MFERLLAALIILALLVLVMFIALPEGERASTRAADPPPVQPASPPSETARAKSPAVEGQTEVAKTDAPPQPPASTQQVQVPNPPGNNSVETGKAAPSPAEKGEREIGSADTQPKRKFVKSNDDRLPQAAELSAEPVEAAKADKPTERLVSAKPTSDKLRVYKPRIDKPRTETVSRIPIQGPGPRVYIKEERERYDGIGEYIQRTRPDRHRTHYYECGDGRCDCSCDRPYWARGGSPCWD